VLKIVPEVSLVNNGTLLPLRLSHTYIHTHTHTHTPSGSGSNGTSLEFLPYIYLFKIKDEEYGKFR
jgi:hypothetical protein